MCTVAPFTHGRWNHSMWLLAYCTTAHTAQLAPSCGTHLVGIRDCLLYHCLHPAGSSGLVERAGMEGKQSNAASSTVHNNNNRATHNSSCYCIMGHCKSFVGTHFHFQSVQSDPCSKRPSRNCYTVFKPNVNVLHFHLWTSRAVATQALVHRVVPNSTPPYPKYHYLSLHLCHLPNAARSGGDTVFSVLPLYNAQSTLQNGCVALASTMRDLTSTQTGTAVVRVCVSVTNIVMNAVYAARYRHVWLSTNCTNQRNNFSQMFHHQWQWQCQNVWLKSLVMSSDSPTIWSTFVNHDALYT